MANSMGSLFIGQAGLQMAQSAIHTTANNLTNVNTTGYVRQQVLFSDRNYITFDRNASISDQQAGLGVSIGDVVHARDVFLDQSYRNECSRSNFYTAYYGAVEEVQNYFQEMEGTQFQEAINNFWVAMQTLADDPADSVNQNLVIQKASLFLSRAQSVQENMENYQDTINIQIRNDVDRVNEIGKGIVELNLQIMNVESNGEETAMTLRDERDNLLDELSELGKVNFKELPNGVVRVSFENTEFIDELTYHPMGSEKDPVTGFINPIWPYLSEYYNEESRTYNNPQYVYQYREKDKDGNFVLQFNTTSPENSADNGELKALLLARGQTRANYLALESSRTGDDLNSETYLDEIGRCIMENTEAETDRLVHSMITAVNDVFCPNKELIVAAGDTLKINGTDYHYGDTVSVNGVDMKLGETDEKKPKLKILDEENAYVGEDGKLPPNELFVRDGCSRYIEAEFNGKKVWIYNEEDPADTSKQYTTKCTKVNEMLRTQPSLLPGLRKSDGKVAYDMGADLNRIWSEDRMQLNPFDTEKCTFKEFYNKMVNDIAIKGTVYKSTSESYEGAVQSIENQRQQVYGVSSDEELQNLIRYQNAYNASSRFMNVISSMMESLIMNL